VSLLIADTLEKRFTKRPDLIGRLVPYTRALIQQSPSIKRRKHVHKPIEGEVPSPLAPPPGCHFHLRCPLAFDRCRVEAPALTRIDGGRHVACHLGNAPLSEFPVTSEKHAA
jgi:oligopeptide/dipeptide ABC transporter ATP-binding protein